MDVYATFLLYEAFPSGKEKTQTHAQKKAFLLFIIASKCALLSNFGELLSVSR